MLLGVLLHHVHGGEVQVTRIEGKDSANLHKSKAYHCPINA